MTGASGRPAYLRWASIGLVFLGGIVGVACREGLTLAIPNVDDVPVVVPVVNIIGAFILGYLYEALSRSGMDAGRSSRIKLLLGTGFCGGLTTYSSLATDTAVLLDQARLDLGAAYALGTVLVGAAATIAGIAVGARLHPHAQTTTTGAGS